ncbi:MAG: HD domain-containing phosphohydrolase [Pseudomonadota bacterium]
MSIRTIRGFFSIGFDLIVVQQQMGYDLFVNASSNPDAQHFVKIFPSGGILTEQDVYLFRKKYHRLYVMEDQRELYLQTLVRASHVPTNKKAEVVKEIAIEHLHDLFQIQDELSNEFLMETITSCHETVEQMVNVIEGKNINEIQDMIGNLSFHDFYTYDHSINVSMYCISIYKTVEPKATHDDLVQIGLAGLLHDLGKMKIPTEIINKPDKLTDQEFEIIQTHPQLGSDILDEYQPKVTGVDLPTIHRVIIEHHENFNGSGYPNKLSGEKIHLWARVCAIADFFDAVTTKRSYAKVLTTDEAVALMAKSAGNKLDPELFESFVKNVKKLVMKEFNRELEDNFDPSQPHRELPFKKLIAKPLGIDIMGKDEKKEKDPKKNKSGKLAS